MNKFIVFEGLDGSGKSTLATMLAPLIKAKVFKTPPKLFEQSRSAIDGSADIRASFFFYLAGVAQASSEIERALETENVICDRYLLSTFCSHVAYGLQVDIGNLCGLVRNPDMTFLITCDAEVRLRRMALRSQSHNDIKARKAGIETRYLEEYRRQPGLIEIDNSSDNPLIALSAICSHIRVG